MQQPDLIRHGPAELARVHRIAAETERRSHQPGSQQRAEAFERQAAEYERQAMGQVAA